jgi:hypothetical protein
MPDDPKHYKLRAETGSFRITGGTTKATLWDAAVTKIKRIRESFGQTHQKQITNVVAWHSLAQSFQRAAQIIDEFKDRVPSDSRPFAFNAALSLELIFKAILAKKGVSIPSGASGHDLRLLCTKAQIALSPQQMTTLELMTEEIIWAGRYPVPNSEQRWNDFHDRILEKHIIRSQSGNVTSARANSETFPNWENYAKIWDLAVAELVSIE